MGKKKINVGNLIGIEWESVLKDPNTDKKIIKNKVESYCIGIDNDAMIPKENLKILLKAILEYHLSNLKDDKEFMENYKKLIEYHKINHSEFQLLNPNPPKRKFYRGVGY